MSSAISFAADFEPFSSLFVGLDPILAALRLDEVLEGWDGGRGSAGSLDRDTIVVSCGVDRPKYVELVQGEKRTAGAGLHARHPREQNVVEMKALEQVMPRVDLVVGMEVGSLRYVHGRCVVRRIKSLLSQLISLNASFSKGK